MVNQVRSLQQADIVDVEALFSTASHYVAPRGLSDYWLYATLFSNTCLVATTDHHITGAALAFINQNDHQDLYLQDLMVAKQSRNQGVAFTLMQALIERATTRNIQRIWLTSENDNKPALALWAKLGFTNPAADVLHNGYWITKDCKGPGKDRVIFERKL